MKQRNEKGQFVAIPNKNERLYSIWCAMKERCNNPNNKRFDRYGGRGIKVCEEWASEYLNFQNWALSNGYREGLTIDRIDNNGMYEPSNCRWVTRKVQNRNYSKNHNLTYKGKTQCIKAWAEETGINSSTILYRIKSGKSIEEVLNQTDLRGLRWKTIS